MDILVMIRFKFFSPSCLLIILSKFIGLSIAFISVNVIAKNAIIHFHKISIPGVYKEDYGIPSLSK